MCTLYNTNPYLQNQPPNSTKTTKSILFHPRSFSRLKFSVQIGQDVKLHDIEHDVFILAWQKARKRMWQSWHNTFLDHNTAIRYNCKCSSFCWLNYAYLWMFCTQSQILRGARVNMWSGGGAGARARLGWVTTSVQCPSPGHCRIFIS